MKAWLITREWLGDHAASDKGEIVCLLNPRLSPERVWTLVEQLYVNEFGSINERVAYAKNAKSWPYHPKCGTAKTKSGKTVGWAYTITCGHNPWYHARPVENVTVAVDDQGKETLAWEEIEKPICADF